MSVAAPLALVREETTLVRCTDSAAEATGSKIPAPFSEIIFEAEGKDRSVRIYQRPLGAEFSKHASGSAQIRKVQLGSYAQELGLEAGWIVKSVDGESLASSTFLQVQQCIKNSLAQLPQRL